MQGFQLIVTKANLNSENTTVEITNAEELEYTGNPLAAEVKVTYRGTELTKGQDVTKPNITPEMVAEAITGSVSGMEGVDPEALKQFNQALIGLLTVKPTEDEHDGS